MMATDFRNTADDFTKSYLETALWSSTDDDDTPMDSNYTVEDMAPKTLDAVIADCAKFRADNEALIDEAHEASGQTMGHFGHDFWLTRNGHGAGFWDGDYKDYGDALTAAAKAFGGIDLYVGDDGLIYAG